MKSSYGLFFSILLVAVVSFLLMMGIILSDPVFPDLLICDSDAGLFLYDCSDDRLTKIDSGLPELKHPSRLLKSRNGDIIILTHGYEDSKSPNVKVEPALIRLHKDSFNLEKIMPLRNINVPTDIVEIDGNHLMLSDRYIGDGNRDNFSCAIYKVDLDNKSIDKLISGRDFKAISSLAYDPATKILYILDADSNPDHLTGNEGAIFSYNFHDNKLLLEKALRTTISPLTLIPINDFSKFIVIDVNSQRPPVANWKGEVFLYDLASKDLSSLVKDHEKLVDPARGFVFKNELILAEASSNPMNFKPEKSGIGFGGKGGRGAIYRISLRDNTKDNKKEKTVDLLLASESFINPVDVISLD